MLTINEAIMMIAMTAKMICCVRILRDCCLVIFFLAMVLHLPVCDDTT